MERLRLNQATSNNRGFTGRQLGSDRMNMNPVTAARELRETTMAHASVSEAETGLARSFVIAQASIYPKYEPAEGWKRGTLFVSLDKPLKGVHGCE